MVGSPHNCTESFRIFFFNLVHLKKPKGSLPWSAGLWPRKKLRSQGVDWVTSKNQWISVLWQRAVVTLKYIAKVVFISIFFLVNEPLFPMNTLSSYWQLSSKIEQHWRKLTKIEAWKKLAWKKTAQVK